MNIFFEFIYNLGILVTVGLISGEIGKNKKYSFYIQGIVFGVGALIVMLHPLDIFGNSSFDFRLVSVSFSALYYGPVSGLITGLLVLSFRFLQDGSKAFVDIGIVLLTTLISLGFYLYFNKRKVKVKYKHIYLMGLFVHLSMVLLLNLSSFGGNIGSKTSSMIFIVFFYPIVTVLLGKIVKNVEEKRQNFEILKQKEEIIQNISKNFQNGMIYQVEYKDGKRIFTYVSDSIKSLYGCTLEEINKNSGLIYSRVHEDDIELLAKAEKESIEMLKDFKAEIRVRNLDGTYRWSYLSSHVRKGLNGTLYFDGIEFIITERKELEEELINQKKKIEELGKTKNEFLTNMSHELKTPMNGIMGLTELLNMTILNLEQRTFVEDIRTSISNLLVIVNDILDISKIEVGKVQVECSNLNLDKLLIEILDLLTYNASSKELELIYDIDESLNILLCADSGKIRQILINIIGNAIKFTEKGYVFVDVKKIEETLEKVKIEFSVKDTGIGIHEKNKEEIFKSFSQGDIDYTRRNQGTGLGLSISQKLVELIGGTLNFESEEGKGTRFYFQMDIKKSKEKVTEKLDIDFEYKNFSVLYVYKYEISRNIVKKILESVGIKIYTAENELSTLDILKNNLNIDLILLDADLAEDASCNIAKEIVKTYNFSKKIISFTNVIDSERINKIKDLGIGNYLTKPIKRKQLLSRIKISYDEIQQMKYNKKNQENMLNKDTKTIFIVEDNYIILNLTIKLLEKLGNFKIVTASNGIEAVEVYKRENPDLIFLDIQMPIMNGYEAYEEIKEIAKEHNVSMPKVVALTAYALEKDKERCLKMGMDDFVAKPFKLDDLKTILDKYL